MNRLSLALLVVFSCQGKVSGLGAALSDAAGAGGASGTGGSGSGGVAPTCQADGAPVGTVPTRRLTRAQYVASAAAFGFDAQSVATKLPSDEVTSGFNGNTNVPVGRRDLEGYLDAAEQLTESLDVKTAWQCDVAKAACAREGVARVGKRILRRPLTDAEQTDFVALWQTQSASPETGVRLMLQALLAMPSFIYRAEIGIGNDEVRALSPYELATRLSFFVVGGPPDEALMAAAEAGTLSTAEGLQNEFLRLNALPQAGVNLRSFYGEWLGVALLGETEKDKNIFPQFTADVRAQLKTETLAFFETAHRKKESLPSLLTSRRAFVSAKTAFLSGVTSNAVETEQIEYATGSLRQGFLTLPGVLAATGHSADHASPIFRGKFIRQNVMCLPLTPPDATVMVVLPPLTPGMTTKERYDALMTDTYCKSCHRLMNPLGYGLLRFNGIGQQIDKDADKPIDDTGAFIATEELDGVFSGPGELSARLASSQLVERCFAKQWFQYAMSRAVQPAEQCTVETLASTLRSSGDVNAAAAAVIQTAAFQKVKILP